MTLTVNLDGVESSNVEALPPGEHLVKITAAVETFSNSGTPGVKVTMTDQAGRLAWDRLWITDKALGILKAKLEAAGYPIPSGEFELVPAALVGRKVKVTVSTEEYGGRERQRVDRWAEVPGQPAMQVPAASVPATRDDDSIPFAPSVM
jgi:hypothetical protein